MSSHGLFWPTDSIFGGPWTRSLSPAGSHFLWPMHSLLRLVDSLTEHGKNPSERSGLPLCFQGRRFRCWQVTFGPNSTVAKRWPFNLSSSRFGLSLRWLRFPLSFSLSACAVPSPLSTGFSAAQDGTLSCAAGYYTPEGQTIAQTCQASETFPGLLRYYAGRATDPWTPLFRPFDSFLGMTESFCSSRTHLFLQRNEAYCSGGFRGSDRR